MSEEQDNAQGFGDFHPEAATYRPYNDAMAAWRNQVRSMQESGALPPPAEEQALEAPETDAEESNSERLNRESVEALKARQDDAESREGESVEVVEDSGPPEAPQEAYDPAGHTAPEVLEYLKGVGYQEAVRVLQAEVDGKNRKGITSLTDDILSKARENDE